VARAPGALLKGPTTRPLQQLRARALVPIHPNAWNRNSTNFAFWAFSEVRTRLGRVASCLWWKGSSRPRSHVGLRGAHAQGGHVMEARTEADTFTMVALSRHRHRPPHANSPSLSW
jgi:hypothetical protein